MRRKPWQARRPCTSLTAGPGAATFFVSAMATLFNRIAESFSSTWLLLSDTTNYLSRAGLLEPYEAEIRDWRAQLSRFRNLPGRVREIRESIVALRKLLRAQGHDLRLGSKDIALEGWRHDDAVAEGFQRLVLGIAVDDIVALAGNANHNDLATLLEERLRARRHIKPYDMHFLWYRWRNQVLVLSGAASETSEQFERLKEYFPTHREFLLRKLSRI
jgi:hypothetical protein